MRDARQRVLDMLRAIEHIEIHVALDEARFRADEVLQGYLVYQLMIVGEAAYKIRVSTEVVDELNRPWGETAFRGV